MSWRSARRLRQAVQVASLLFFLVLAFGTLQRYAPRLPADAFFRFDPLTAFGAMIAHRSWLWHLAPALITVVATVVLGRVWCGWICPMGTVLEYTRFGKARRRQKRLPPRLRLTKYVLLVMIVGRSRPRQPDADGARPDHGGHAQHDGVRHPGHRLPGARRGEGHGARELAAGRGELDRQHRPRPRAAGGGARLRPGPVPRPAVPRRHRPQRARRPFLVPLPLPAGRAARPALQGRRAAPAGRRLLHVVQPLRRRLQAGGDRCGGHGETGRGGRRRAGCPEASPARSYEVVTSECTVCLDCLVACPADVSMRVGLQAHAGPWREYDPGRRQFLAATAAGVGGVVLLGAGWWNKVKPARLIRPPGVHDEGAFLSSCVRCGACLDVCPTSGLQPTLDEAGWPALWTPALKPRLGYCAWQCTSCGQVCPTGAIPRLHLSTKRRDVIGTAVIDRSRCLPWSQGKSCVVCQEVCPVPHNAIDLTGRQARHDARRRGRVHRLSEGAGRPLRGLRHLRVQLPGERRGGDRGAAGQRGAAAVQGRRHGGRLSSPAARQRAYSRARPRKTRPALRGSGAHMIETLLS